MNQSLLSLFAQHLIPESIGKQKGKLVSLGVT